MLRAIIFDMDGTMIDSEIIQSRAFERILREHNITPIKNEHGTVHISGMTTPETWEYFKKLHGFTADTANLTRRKRAAVLEVLKQEVVALPGLTELLTELHAHNIPLAVASSAQRERITLVLDKLGPGHYFSAIVSANDIKHGKPAPDAYLAAAELLKVEPADCVVFEDADVGVQSGKAAGMKVVAVPNEYTKRMDFSGADVVLPSLADVTIDMLTKLAA